jgi:hypothetical protein
MSQESKDELVKAEIRNLQDLIDDASDGNPDIPRWEQEIKNKKAYLDDDND